MSLGATRAFQQQCIVRRDQFNNVFARLHDTSDRVDLQLLDCSIDWGADSVC